VWTENVENNQFLFFQKLKFTEPSRVWYQVNPPDLSNNFCAPSRKSTHALNVSDGPWKTPPRNWSINAHTHTRLTALCPGTLVHHNTPLAYRRRSKGLWISEACCCCSLSTVAEASERRGRSPPQCWNHGGESIFSPPALRPTIFPHFCMLFLKLPLLNSLSLCCLHTINTSHSVGTSTGRILYETN